MFHAQQQLSDAFVGKLWVSSLLVATPVPICLIAEPVCIWKAGMLFVHGDTSAHTGCLTSRTQTWPGSCFTGVKERGLQGLVGLSAWSFVIATVACELRQKKMVVKQGLLAGL